MLREPGEGRARRFPIGHKVVVVAAWIAAAAVGPGATAAWAHGGPGAAADSMTTVLLLGGAGSLSWFRRLRKRPDTSRTGRRIWLLPLAAVVAWGLALTAGAWVPRARPARNRPVTSARLAILEPTQDATTGPDVTVKLDLTGATIAPAGSTRLIATEGHVHLYLDGRLVSMAYGLSQDLTGLAPGPHSVRAEFVAADHGPFKNPVVAAVGFDVVA
jgi:hypothetical protein